MSDKTFHSLLMIASELWRTVESVEDQNLRAVIEGPINRLLDILELEAEPPRYIEQYTRINSPGFLEEEAC